MGVPCFNIYNKFNDGSYRYPYHGQLFAINVYSTSYPYVLPCYNVLKLVILDLKVKIKRKILPEIYVCLYLYMCAVLGA